MQFQSFILIILMLLISSKADEKHVVKIGALFFDNELDLVKSFDTAIAEINQLDYNIELFAIKHFLTIDDSKTIQELTCDLIENGIAAIFGPSSKTNSDIVEVLSNITGIPHLQFDWHMQETERHRINHQLTVNVAPTELALSEAYYDILRSKDWNSFSIVFERQTSLARLQHVLAWKQLHKTGIKMYEFQRGDDYRVLWKRVSSAREKYVLLECPPDILEDVVNASRFFNMTVAFNNLFLSNLNTHMGGFDRFYSNEFLVATSAVRLRNYVPPPAHDEIDVFDIIDEEQLLPLSNQLIYDAVVLYFNALREFLGSLRYYAPQVSCGHGFWSDGPQLIKSMKRINPKNVRPHYRTQRLRINELGERDDFNLEVYNPLIDRITHVWNKKYKLVPYIAISDNTTKSAKQRKMEQKVDFSQKRVRYTVSARIGEPYFMWREEPEGVHYEGNERFEGYAVDLIYKLGNMMGFDIVFEPVPDNNYGSYDAVNNEWNGIIRQLIDNKAQLGICDLTITQERRAVVDFTAPFMQLGVSILSYKVPPPPVDIFAFLRPYSLDVWMYLLIMVLLSSMTFVLVARISEAEWVTNNATNTNNNGNQTNTEEVSANIWHIQNTLWLVLGSMLNQGCDLLPRGLAMRILTAFWWIFALLISQTYIAKLASFITASKIGGSIKDLQDLVDQNKVQFGTIKGGATSLYFAGSNDTVNRMAWNKMKSFKPDAFTKDNKEGVDRVKRSKGSYAFLMETTGIQYYVKRNCELTQIGEPFGQKHYGIAMPLNSPYRTNLSVGILRLSEKGYLLDLKNKWFNDNTTVCNAPGSGTSMANSSQFNMDSVGGLFMVLIGGLLVSIIFGISEFLMHVQYIAVREKIPPMVVLKAEFNFFIRFWLQRKPLYVYRMSRNSTSTAYSSMERQSNASSAKGRKKLRKSSNEASA